MSNNRILIIVPIDPFMIPSVSHLTWLEAARANLRFAIENGNEERASSLADQILTREYEGPR